MKGYIHSVETFGTVDNGGIRFVLFLQGCALQCSFCHNPDTWLRRGQPVTIAEILDQLIEYKQFFDLSGGGLTVSGGEPLLQHLFVRELFIEAGKLGIHRALDTAGYCRRGNIADVLPHTDLLLFSLKVVDPKKHKKLTAGDNEEILQNLSLAAATPVDLVICYVLIPTINDTEKDVADLSRLVKSFARPIPVDVLPYHKMGVAKWKQLGLCDPLAQIPPATPTQVAAFQDELRRNRITLH